MLSLANLKFDTTPYPHGIATEVFEPDVYAAMVAQFPLHVSEYVEFGGGNHKWSLSEVNNQPAYRAFVTESKLWSALHHEVKSAEFRDTVMDAVKEFVPPTKTTARFEFSVLPANGGCLRPHRDIKSKIVTLVIPMVRSDEWKPEWGGGTDMLVPKAGVENPADYATDFENFEIAKSAPYVVNQAFVFLRSDISWHSVGPIQGPKGKTRRTLTVNIETA